MSRGAEVLLIRFKCSIYHEDEWVEHHDGQKCHREEDGNLASFHLIIFTSHNGQLPDAEDGHNEEEDHS